MCGPDHTLCGAAADTVIALPVTINGIGLRESTFEILLAPLSVGGELAVAVALTRWVGELQRAAVGGILFLIGDRVGAVNPLQRGRTDG